MEYLIIFSFILIAATGYILAVKNNRPTLRKLAVIFYCYFTKG